MFLSIVIPSYNQGDFIKDCFESIVKVKKKTNDVEVILIDACSNDQTQSYIEKYKKFFDIVIIEKDKGQADAINKGFGLATGQWLTWLNTDDLISPNIIEILKSHFVINENPDIVYGDSYRLIDNNHYYKKTPLNSEKLLWRSYGFVQPSVFFTKNIYEKSNGIDTNLKYVMDWDLFFQFKLMQAKFIYIPVSLSTTTIHKDQKSRSNKLKDRLRRAEETYKVISNHSSGPYVECYYKSLRIFSFFNGFGFNANIGIIIWTIIIFIYFKIFLMSYNTINIKEIWHSLKTMKT